MFATEFGDTEEPEEGTEQNDSTRLRHCVTGEAVDQKFLYLLATVGISGAAQREAIWNRDKPVRCQITASRDGGIRTLQVVPNGFHKIRTGIVDVSDERVLVCGIHEQGPHRRGDLLLLLLILWGIGKEQRLLVQPCFLEVAMVRVRCAGQSAGS